MFNKNRYLWSKITDHCRKYSLYKQRGRILLAVSGGPDSVCMAHFFAHHAKKAGIRVLICHVNHKLRGKQADTDEKFVRRLGRRLNIRTVTRTVNTRAFAKKRKLSIEHAARKLRYAALFRTAEENGCSTIATAHHLDDHAETILLNLLRGTNPAGMFGIPVKRNLGINSKSETQNPKHKIGNSKTPVTIIRPVMCLTKNEILDYLKSAGLKYRKDKTNESEKHTRNWLRKTLLPLIETKQPKFKQHLLELAHKLSSALNPDK